MRGNFLVEFRILYFVLRMLSFDFNGIFNQGCTDGTSMGGSLMGKEFLFPSVPVWDFIIETMFWGLKTTRNNLLKSHSNAADSLNE